MTRELGPRARRARAWARRGFVVGLAIAVPATIASWVSPIGAALHPFLVPDTPAFDPLSRLERVWTGFWPLVAAVVLNGVVYATLAGVLGALVTRGGHEADRGEGRRPRSSPRRWAMYGFVLGAAATVPSTMFALVSPVGEALHPYVVPGPLLVRPLLADALATWPGAATVTIACLVNGLLYALVGAALARAGGVDRARRRT